LTVSSVKRKQVFRNKFGNPSQDLCTLASVTVLSAIGIRPQLRAHAEMVYPATSFTSGFSKGGLTAHKSERGGFVFAKVAAF
jgi:hypothetical protein